MRRVLACLAVAGSVEAGVVQGVVLEQISGRPLARAVVRLDPVRGAGEARPLTVRAGRSGQFVFPAVVPGLYVLAAVSDGYFPAAYGQRRPLGHGIPFPVTGDSELFAELRLRHKGAVTGRVLDENGVGKAGVPVMAYRARLPLRAAGTATSDDRGVYRIHGLDPGRYWVRSAPHTLDDGSGWLPTWGPQARESREARAHPVAVDSDTADADVSPEPGSLFHLAGVAACDSSSVVTVTLSSETGHRSTQVLCHESYRFDGLASAAYEIFARTQDGAAAGFFETFLDRESEAGTVQIMTQAPVRFEVRESRIARAANVDVTLIGRRQDMSESGQEREISGRSAVLDPGNWEFRARPPKGWYVESITGTGYEPRRPWRAERADDWYDVYIESRRYPITVRVTVSDKPGQIAGRVIADGKAVAGAPVFLWPVAAAARRSLGGAPQTLADTEGRFEFDGLPPGEYRVVSTFDATESGEELMELSNARAVQAGASQTTQVELPLWSAP